MKKNFLVLTILFLAMGFVFGSNIALAQDSTAQPVPAPFIKAYGNNWAVYHVFPIKTFPDLGAEVALVVLKDKNDIGGLIEVLYVIKGGKGTLLAGWMHPYSDNEQGFVLQEDDTWLELDKKKDIGQYLDWEGQSDPNGDPLIVFYLVNSDSGQKQCVRRINIREFLENK